MPFHIPNFVVFYKDATSPSDPDDESVMKSAHIDSNIELNQKMNLILNFILSSEAFSRKNLRNAVAAPKSNADQSSSSTALSVNEIGIFDVFKIRSVGLKPALTKPLCPVSSGADVGNLKNETDELWDLLKKTQSEVNVIENEMNRVETENIHQDLGFKIF